ncbi:Flp pilus assembly protein CpaB [Zhongshania sp.]|jgi:pilus assembly protein CpaB|uniref:Flp pilus assembly protein CpaB n=1 Tax=Zhongshania sp. TaxID=1971902 RepID=UPI0035692FA0
MQSRTLKIIAALLIISAIVMGIIGYKISREDAQRQSSVSISSTDSSNFTYAQKVLITTRNIAKGDVLLTEDLQALPFPITIDDGFEKIADVVNKTAEAPIAKGAIIRQSDFEVRSLLASHITSGHRALAVKVDEVIGSGGFLLPGDYVDVIFTTRASKETYDKSLSRRILRNVRVLAFGSEIEGKAIPSSNTDIKTKAKKSSTDKDSGKRSRSAVLEVALNDINTLVLAENSGVLRLVGVGDADSMLENGNASNQLDNTEDKATMMRAVTGLKPPAAPKSVYVYSGDKVETIRVKN